MFKKKDLRWLGFRLEYGIPEEIPLIYCHKIMDNVADIEDERISRFFQPKIFNAFLFKQTAYALSHSTDKVIRHIDNLIINKGQRELLYMYMIHLIKLDPLKLKEIFFQVSLHKDLEITVKRLEYELNVLKRQFEEAEKLDQLVEKYDWERITNKLKTIESINNKLVFLFNLKHDYLLDCENANENLDYLDIIPQCEIEIERLKILLSFETNNDLLEKNKFITSTDEDEVKESQSQQGDSSKKDMFPEIFAEGCYKVFQELNDKYQKDDNVLKAKYSNLFHFFTYQGFLKCTQKEYINFIKENYGIKMSKILPKTDKKYNDIIQPLLMRYLKGQL